MQNNPKVSVCVVTYNHEKYIRECLESIVTQKCDFDFEVIVGEDCSTDNTRVIVQEYVDKYPDIVKPLFHKENVGAVNNIILVYSMSQSKYICHIDGDDYTLPNKLQTQYDILENNADCIICSHDMELIDNNGKRLNKSFIKYKKGKYTLIDLYETLPFFAHSSKMFVNDLDDKYWNELDSQALDIEVHVQQLKKGNIYHIENCLGVYRTNTGVSINTGTVNPLLTNGVDRIFNDALKNKKLEKNLIEKYYSKSYLNFAYQSAVLKDSKGFVKYIKKSINIKIISIMQIVIYILSYYPKIALFLVNLRHKNRYKS